MPQWGLVVPCVFRVWHKDLVAFHTFCKHLFTCHCSWRLFGPTTFSCHLGVKSGFHNTITFQLHACMVASLTLKVEGWGLLDIQHVWMEDGDIRHSSWWNTKPLLDECFCEHVQRVEMRLVKTVDGQVVPERWKCISFSLRIMKISGHTNGSVDQLIGRQVPILSNNAPILYPSIHIIKSLSIVVVDDTFI